VLLYYCIPKNSESVWGIEKKYKNQIQLLCANSDPMGTIVHIGSQIKLIRPPRGVDSDACLV
jgi:hypothetical protein